jgi:hypothetical protein
VLSSADERDLRSMWPIARSIWRCGGDYPETTNDFNQALQFQQQKNCVSAAGPYAQYCSTVLR